MRIFMMMCIVTVLAVSSSCVRMPEKYAYVLDRAADANDKLLDQTENMPLEKRAEVYKIIIQEDNKTLRAAAQTIRNGGGD